MMNRPVFNPTAPAPAANNPGMGAYNPISAETFTMPRPPVVPRLADLAENLITFDDRLVELQWEEGHWQLWASGMLLKDFGRHEREGREALRLIHELRLNQFGTVGAPRPIMEYWLSDGQAPQGMTPGLHKVPLDTTSLRVDQIQDCWCLRDSARVLFNFGAHQDEAERALSIIQRHGFVQVGYIGEGTAMMLVFLGGSGLTPTPLKSPPPPAGRMIARSRLIGADAKPAGLTQTNFQTSQLAVGGPRPAMQMSADPQHPRADAQSGQVNPALLTTSRQLAPPSMPLPDLAALGERVPLDMRQVRVVHERQGYKLLCGTYVIADFGTSERDAQQAEAAIHTYRFTEQCLIGHPKPVFSYFLVNGRAPHGLPLGLQGTAFHPQELAVRQEGSGWAICYGDRNLIPFGDKADEARQALQAIQRFEFDTVCRIGQGETAMTILARTR
jgi:hypothetical protein